VALGSSTAALAGPAPAPVPGAQATVGAGDTYIAQPQANFHDHYIGLDASGALPLGSSGVQVQAGASYHNEAQHGLAILRDGVEVDGALVWQGAIGRFGGAADYSSKRVEYGLYAEAFPARVITLGIRAGNVTDGGEQRHYVGADVVVYPWHDLALASAGDGVSGGSSRTVFDASMRAEYLFSPTIPVSAYAGYTYFHEVGGSTGYVLLVGLTYYFGAAGAHLEQRQRTGVDAWGPLPPQQRFP